MIRFFFTLIFVGSLCYGVWRINESHPELKDKAFQLMPQSTAMIIEPRFTSTQIIENEENNLSKQDRDQLSESQLLFYPFLLLEVKFSRPNLTTGEGVILWDLIDGEMVLNSNSWEKSHGFADCIYAHTDSFELKILRTLAEHGNSLDRKTLFQALKADTHLLDAWLNRCIKKKLIVFRDGLYRIHVESPKMAFTPITELHFPLITKQSKNPQKMKRHFSPTQICRLAEASFGNDFAIREATEIFIPIYAFHAHRSDGSMQTFYFNALNGQELHLKTQSYTTPTP